ncbi:MAG: 3-oxoacyl-[acyl-carrier-protein] reductase [Elusimicrobiota bacterium]|jgi:3-oxoacyl-[acyl-carrier protein] reductase|nr:3-oxoacyl-[acyl-carrier-protein] reductase [Elusimicrobiota bacterium]
MTKKLAGKVVLITGAGQGIGREIALSLADEGADICVTDVNIEIAEETKKLIQEKNCKAKVYKLDVSNLVMVEEICEKIVEDFEKIDILINNAGVTKDNLIMRMSEKDWDFVLNINLKGSFNCIKAVTKYMIKKRYGKIINISSIVGVRGNAGQANYSASKGGIIALTKTCAKELGSRNINVNAIAPGFIATKMTDILGEKAKEKLVENIPLNRLGTAKDIAKACLFLASSDADYITGQTLQVDGGIMI